MSETLSQKVSGSASAHDESTPLTSMAQSAISWLIDNSGSTEKENQNLDDKEQRRTTESAPPSSATTHQTRKEEGQANERGSDAKMSNDPDRHPPEQNTRPAAPVERYQAEQLARGIPADKAALPNVGAPPGGQYDADGTLSLSALPDASTPKKEQGASGGTSFTEQVFSFTHPSAEKRKGDEVETTRTPHDFFLNLQQLFPDPCLFQLDTPLGASVAISDIEKCDRVEVLFEALKRYSVYPEVASPADEFFRFYQRARWVDAFERLGFLDTSQSVGTPTLPAASFVESSTTPASSATETTDDGDSEVLQGNRLFAKDRACRLVQFAPGGVKKEDDKELLPLIHRIEDLLLCADFAVNEELRFKDFGLAGGQEPSVEAGMPETRASDMHRPPGFIFLPYPGIEDKWADQLKTREGNGRADKSSARPTETQLFQQRSMANPFKMIDFPMTYVETKPEASSETPHEGRKWKVAEKIFAAFSGREEENVAQWPHLLVTPALDDGALLQLRDIAEEKSLKQRRSRPGAEGESGRGEVASSVVCVPEFVDYRLRADLHPGIVSVWGPEANIRRVRTNADLFSSVASSARNIASTTFVTSFASEAMTLLWYGLGASEEQKVAGEMNTISAALSDSGPGPPDAHALRHSAVLLLSMTMRTATKCLDRFVGLGQSEVDRTQLSEQIKSILGLSGDGTCFSTLPTDEYSNWSESSSGLRTGSPQQQSPDGPSERWARQSLYLQNMGSVLHRLSKWCAGRQEEEMKQKRKYNSWMDDVAKKAITSMRAAGTPRKP
ncbi:unnamed protein product [Amoebophrya sp. A120]|nr:unnamed protein product [Amoebophrya sp. A120]|eukprot:GSA120T00024009001.1